MKKVILILLVMAISAGAGLAAGIMFANHKNKAVIADMQAKLDKSDTDAQQKNRYYDNLVSKLSGELRQARAEITLLKTPPQPQTEEAPSISVSAETPLPENTTLYTVQTGDSLWIIAKNQLGSGSRFNEILKLNPNISENSTLAVGSTLKIPAK
jgi:Tfp pilus assembly protein FimV